MSKILLVIPEARPHIAPRILRLLGIDYDIAYYAGGAGNLQTPHGEFAWNDDTGIRAYLRNYTAVLAGLEYAHANTGIYTHLRSLRWLAFNDPEDPPVAYLGCPPNAVHTGFTYPSDCPIIRPTISDDANTMFQITSGGVSTAGLKLRFHRENTELYTTAIAFERSSAGVPCLFRLDLAKHAALGAQGEILVEPVAEDLTIPANTVAAYRYKNRYFLPIVLAPRDPNTRPSSGAWGLFWLFYALKCLNVPTRYSIPIYMVMDDALTLHGIPTGAEAILPTFAQWTHIAKETYRYLAEVIYPRSGLAMVCGLFTGGRYDRRSVAVPHENTHWDLVERGRRWTGSAWETLDTTTQANLREWHNLLVRHCQGALPCTPHDHTLSLRANWNYSNFKRHADAGYPHAAPNNVPITRGTTLVKADAYPAAPPSGYRERFIDGERYYEWGFTTSGATDTISNINPNNLYGARVLWEAVQAEMRALGFPDLATHPDYALLIAPGGMTGDPSLWRALRERGVRAIRANLPRGAYGPPFDSNPVLWGFPYATRDEIHFFLNADLDASAQYDSNFGLYHPTYASRTPVGRFGLEASGDISSLWNTDRPTASQRAYRRAICVLTDRWFLCAGLTHALMTHPYNWMTWADPANPTRPFDKNDPDSRINFLLELAWNMERIVAVLSPYLKFGSVSDAIALRERVMS